MSSNSTKIKNSAVIVPVASPTLSDQGELAYDSSIDKLKIRNVASTDNVLQEANVATVTNKVIDAGDNTITGIADANIDASAAIDVTKLADGSVDNTEFQYLNGATSNIQDQLDTKMSDALPDGEIFIGNVSNVATAQAVSGDISISNAGVVAISTDVIVDADVNSAAAIAGTKIDPDFGAQDIATTGAADVGNIHIATNTISSTNTNGNINLDPNGTGQVRSESEIRIPEVVTPATPTSGYGLVYFKSDGFLYQLNDAGTETKVGAGSGGINYIINNGAESDTSGWVTYADAAGPIPVDGTGGSPTVTWTRTTSSPLRGTGSFLFTKDAANRQGEGASYDLTCDSADQAKVLSLSFDYEIASGTYSGGTSSTNSDLIVYVYRTTATGRLMEPSVIKLDGGVVGTKYTYRGEIQTDSDATGYRLILHVSTTSTSAYTVKFDNFAVGPQQYAYGSIITDWVDYIPTGSWAANTVYTGKWRRVGSEAEFDVNIRTTGAPTGTLSVINLPSGMLIDTNKLAAGGDSENFTLGIVSIFDSGGIEYAGRIEYISQTEVQPRVFRADSTYVDPGTAISATIPFTFGNADEIYIKFSAPIVGWGATATLGQDADTRVVAMVVSDPTPTLASFTALTNNIVLDTAPEIDTHGGYNTTTGGYTIPVAGIYNIGASFELTGTETSDNRALLYIYKNGSLLSQLASTRVMSAGLTTVPIYGSYPINVVAGDIISIRIDYDATAPAFASTGFNRFWVQRESGPAQIAASEFVGMAVTAAIPTGGTNGASTTIIGDTPLFDTHGGYNSGTGFYTIPVAGTYNINAALLVQGTASAGNRSIIEVRKNTSTAVANFIERHDAGLASEWQVMGNCTRRFVAGDTISIRMNTSIASPVFTTGSTEVNYLEITKVGN